MLRTGFQLFCLAILGTAMSQEFEVSTGMPPFAFLAPSACLRAGHTTHIKMLMFNEISGNITIKYHNYTNVYYPERLYYQDVIMEETFEFDLDEDNMMIDFPIEVPEEVVGKHGFIISGYAEGYGRFNYTNKDLCTAQTTGHKVYVQTDKPIYKPGQTVRYRGFVVDSNLKASNPSDGMNFKINNPNSIEVHSEQIVRVDSPIFEGSFILAEEATIGTYQIKAMTSSKGSAYCSFSVEEYVLPKFGVEIKGPKHIGAADTIIRGKVTATYTYGKPVNGRVVLKFAVDNKQQSMYSGAYHFQELTTELVEGEADWEVDITDLTTRKLRYLFNPFCTPSNLVITASVSDTQGGFTAEKVDSSTQFSQTSAKLSFNKNTQKNYAAGFPYYVELDVEALTGTGVDGMSVKLTMISGLSDLKYVTRRVTVSDGKVFALFQVPEDACAVKITAEMDIEAACDEVFACFQPERLVSKGDEFVRFVKSEPRSYSAGDSASYRIFSTKEFETLHFVILSKGSIVKSWNQAPEWNLVDDTGKYSTEGTVTIPSDMITRSRLIVMSANPLSGHILADAIDLCIVEDLKHSMNLRVDTEIANPGQNVTLYLSSDPASFVGISVNDASLNLLREPCKVLTKDSTLSFLRGLDSGTSKELSCKRDDPYQCTSSTEVKIIDIHDLMKSEGLDVMTNMLMFNYEKAEPVRRKNDYHTAPYYMAMSAESGRDYDYMEYSEDAVADEEFSAEEEDDSDASSVRDYFPEAWLWTDMVSNEEGANVISVIAPDTITAWKGSAFGLSSENGLGFSNEIEFKTFLPFFISLDLPYSGIVGERISIPVRLFNYMDSRITVDVQISSEMWGDFESTRLSVDPDSATTVEYEISLTEAGNHEITVTAETRTGESDSVRKSLLVQPGGEKIVDTNSVLIMQKRDSSAKAMIDVELPDGFIPGSHKLKAIAVGDILGEAVSGISNLIQLPSGCGEQNMHKVAVNVFSANYLRSLYDELPQNLDYNIKHNLNVGLQQQLAYRKGNAGYSSGYSVFKGGETSHWLTAFVNKVVGMFPEDIPVPCTTGLNTDRTYMLGKVYYPEDDQYKTAVTREGWAPYQYSYHTNKRLYWQSYFLISVLESASSHRCGEVSSYYNERVEAVCNSTMLLSEGSDDCCYHHMVAYSLQLCRDYGHLDHVEDWKKSSFVKQSKRCMGSSNDRKYKFATCQENLEFESVKASSRSIEATAYAALYFMQKGELEESIPMIMWLASQRNENGGFRSSQDTVMGLQALAKFAEMSKAVMPKKTDLTISVGKGKTYFEKMKFKEHNKMTVKEAVLTPAVGSYKIRWSGVGVAFFQMISEYHVSDVDYEPVFALEAAAVPYQGFQAVNVAFKLPKDYESSMYLLEMRAPTGLVFKASLIEGQMQMTEGGFTAITRYDIKEGGQRLHLYIDPTVESRKIELHVPMDFKFSVVDRMPAQVTLIDYYDPSQRQTVFYTALDDVQEY